MLARQARRGLVGRGPPMLGMGVRRMTGTPVVPPPMGKAEDPLLPNLVIEEAASGLDAGLPMKYDRDIWANPEELLPERHELWWDDGTAEPEWYVDRFGPAHTENSRCVIELLSMFTLVLGGVGGLAVLSGADLHKRAAPRVEHGWPVDLEEYRKQECGRGLAPEALEGIGEEEEE
uniref:Uncharacterized protein n=1 Tax=Phaeocystis cordata TaxID=118079 RepID=A0A7S1HQX1_9EUKA|mmetsp:Transcript_32/g.83  ORF Transcript_32/g.83 Transcript_32/m.83 type:complete len:176 (+) Transcript_32:20-547(+)|eukprot:Transcript_8514.p4 GENE.Transcript_8514~~Transcript_8514.p4  ORF type:complete len:176 (+),score=35.50 Transcript_8514:86-613(+)